MSHCVIVVDDDYDTRAEVADLLSEHGFSVRTAAHGQEALELLRTHGASVIVLDLMMPVMDGVDFRKAQMLEPAISSIPFVLMTGRIDCRGLQQSLGAAACLRKPFLPTELVDAVRRSCSESAATDNVA